MTEELSLRVWFKDSHNLAPEIKIKTDSLTGRKYVQFQGGDSFDIARLLPRDQIELVTIRHSISRDDLHGNSLDSGVYKHGPVRITAERSALRSPTNHAVSLTARDIDQAEEAYNLFRQGKLARKAWE